MPSVVLAGRQDEAIPLDRRTLGQLALLFGRLSLTSFGGPAAHIAMMRREIVEQRNWLSDTDFLDLIGASNVIPGPTSTEVAMHTGRRRGGPVGFLVAGLAFILPAAALMLVMAWGYTRFGTTPRMTDAFDGVKPVVVAVVANAVVGLGRTAVKSRTLAMIGLAVVVAYLGGVNEPVLLLAAAALAGMTTVRRRIGPGPRGSGEAMIVAPLVFGLGRGLSDPDLSRLFAVFLKVGALLFGSGYVLFAFLQRDLVLSRGWLTESQLLDAIAVGQFTPGPLFTTATFVGYLLNGVPGAAVATVAIFLPAFLMVALLGPVVDRLRSSALTGAALDGLNVAAVGVMAGVTWALGHDAVTDVSTAVIAIASLIALVRYRVNAAWLMLAGGCAGLLLG
ncbi:MAG: chromate efflux transporter [Acidimicrobiia bacterium]